MNSLTDQSEDPAQQLVQLRQRVAELEAALQEERTRHQEREVWFQQKEQAYLAMLEGWEAGASVYDLFKSSLADIYRLEAASQETAAALAESERQYRDLVKYAPAGIFELDFRTGQFTAVNDAMCQVTGYSRDELLSMGPFDLLDQRSQEVCQARINQWRSGNEPPPGMDYRARGKDGRELWVSLKVAPIADGAAPPRGLSVVAHDVTERKRAEEEVRNARDCLEEKVAERTRELTLERQRLFEVLETLPANICLISPHHKILFSNGAFRQRYGETNGKSCYEYMYGLDQPCEGCQSLSPLVTKQPIHWIFTAPDGAIIDVYDFPFIDMDGTTKILEMSIDITQQRKMEAELARMDRLNLIGQMAAGIGHEIRNPMTAVRGFLQMLGSKPEYAEDLAFFELMIEELDRANSIISEFLGLARDKMVNLQPGSLDLVINMLYPMIRSEANLREITVHLELDGLSPCLIDRNEIRQLVLNLSRNAMDAMSSHGALTIGTRQEGEEVILYIRDEGNGLSPAIIDKLGTPFQTTKDNGTGLGLAICYSIAARHNARIDFETGREGTTFFVHFPTAGEMNSDHLEETGGGGGNLTIPSPQPKIKSISL